MVLFRILLILQVVRLVLTYNFSNCDSEEISKIYPVVIFPDLRRAFKGVKFNQIEHCDSRPACLLKIEYYTLNPVPGCPSLSNRTFALETKRVLTNYCPGYSKTERNSTREMARDVEKICRDQILQIRGLWLSFIQSPQQN